MQDRLDSAPPSSPNARARARTLQKKQAKMCMAPKRMKKIFSSRIRDGLMSSRSDRMLPGPGPAIRYKEHQSSLSDIKSFPAPPPPPPPKSLHGLHDTSYKIRYNYKSGCPLLDKSYKIRYDYKSGCPLLATSYKIRYNYKSGRPPRAPAIRCTERQSSRTMCRPPIVYMEAPR